MCCFSSTLNKSKVLVMSCTKKVWVVLFVLKRHLHMGTTMSDWMITPPKIGFGKGDSSFKYGFFMLFPVSTLNFSGVMVCVSWVFVSCPVFRRENPTFATTCSCQVFPHRCGCFWSSVPCGISNVSRWTVGEPFPTWKQKRCWSYVAQHMSRRSGNEKNRVGKVCWGSPP